ncbi:hypothetical protein D9757_005811 [Collybiopsis confluens]|uniref:Xylanolytic transcriptional activator regulatory domain-containing protein n=1 Tax=Collybiopsis confluens TaxID=2823264 RepID=A0A8H5HPQ1_9AGAR|nr:hypothetical protein D9757_005811 [Collybiopsis confluens]
MHPAPSSVQLSPSGFEDVPQVVGHMLERFRQEVCRVEGERPIFALLNASYLWGMQLSASRNPPEQEAILISRAIQSSAPALSERHPQKILQYMQSLVLLANYFYRAGRVMEARYHTTAAASLVLSNGLHQIRMDSRYPGISGTARLSDPLARSPCDAAEEGERINAFWTVLILDAFWNTVHGYPSSIPFTTSMARVDTPWPRLEEEYSQAPFDRDFRSSLTIDRFLSGAPDNWRNHSAKGNFAKAAVLFERATFTALQFKNNPALRQSQPGTLMSLSTVIRKFIQDIPPPHRDAKSSVNYQLCMLSLAHAAEIQLFFPFAGNDAFSRSRALKAAKAVVDLIEVWVPSLEVDYIDPMLAMIWTDCCRVFCDEAKRLTGQGSSHSDLRQPPPFTQREIRTFCAHIIAGMEAHRFPLMGKLHYLLSFCHAITESSPELQLRQVKPEFDKIYSGIK